MTSSVALPAVYREAVAFFAAGKSPEAVLDLLLKKGLLEQYAKRMVAAAQAESQTA